VCEESSRQQEQLGLRKDLMPEQTWVMIRPVRLLLFLPLDKNLNSLAPVLPQPLTKDMFKRTC
jgi:hypothetical protein